MIIPSNGPPVVFGMRNVFGVAGLGDSTPGDFFTAIGGLKWLAIGAAVWFAWNAFKSGRGRY